MILIKTSPVWSYEHGKEILSLLFLAHPEISELLDICRRALSFKTVSWTTQEISILKLINLKLGVMTVIFNPSTQAAEAGRLSSRPAWMIYVDLDSKNKKRQQKEEALLQSELQLKTDIYRKKLAPPTRGEKGMGRPQIRKL